mmetsp:Transcript_602/g.2053  ORF Transcript_602/g.2053 Transcript_602/m.2053 type:complete len:291 (-) Transcript_602:217-1089(-)
MYVPAPFENLNKTTLSHSTQARHRCELARASTITGTPQEPQQAQGRGHPRSRSEFGAHACPAPRFLGRSPGAAPLDAKPGCRTQRRGQDTPPGSVSDRRRRRSPRRLRRLCQRAPHCWLGRRDGQMDWRRRRARAVRRRARPRPARSRVPRAAAKPQDAGCCRRRSCRDAPRQPRGAQRVRSHVLRLGGGRNRLRRAAFPRLPSGRRPGARAGGLAGGLRRGRHLLRPCRSDARGCHSDSRRRRQHRRCALAERRRASATAAAASVGCGRPLPRMDARARCRGSGWRRVR